MTHQHSYPHCQLFSSCTPQPRYTSPPPPRPPVSPDQGGDDDYTRKDLEEAQWAVGQAQALIRARRGGGSDGGLQPPPQQQQRRGRLSWLWWRLQGWWQRMVQPVEQWEEGQAAAGDDTEARDEAYVAAMAVRVGTQATWGEAWQAAERRYSQALQVRGTWYVGATAKPCRYVDTSWLFSGARLWKGAGYGYGVQGTGCKVRGTGCGVRGTGYRVQGTGYGVQGAGYRVQGTGCRVQGTGYRVQGTGYRVQGTGYRVQGVGCRVQVQDSWYRVQPPQGAGAGCRVEGTR